MPSLRSQLLSPNELGLLTNTSRYKWLKIIKADWFVSRALLNTITVYHSSQGYLLTQKNKQTWQKILTEYDEYIASRPRVRNKKQV